MSVYLDHAACTKLRPLVKDFLRSENLEEKFFGNPSSIHQNGRTVRQVIDESRQIIKDIVECEIDEIIFTSGATESLRLAIVGGYLGIETPRKKIFVSPLCHSAVFSALNFLEKYFEVEINFLPLDKQGFLDIENISDDIFENSDLIIVEHGNSEIGVLQPVIKLGRKIEAFKSITSPLRGTPLKLRGDKSEFPLFIVDAAASVVTERVGLKFQKADLMVFSGEKFEIYDSG